MYSILEKFFFLYPIYFITRKINFLSLSMCVCVWRRKKKNNNQSFDSNLIFSFLFIGCLWREFFKMSMRILAHTHIHTSIPILFHYIQTINWKNESIKFLSNIDYLSSLDYWYCYRWWLVWLLLVRRAKKKNNEKFGPSTININTECR